MKILFVLTFAYVSISQCQFRANPAALGNHFAVAASSIPAENISVLSSHPVPGDQTTEGEKSVALAGLYSLLLPGMGELYAGDYSFGKYLTIAEGGLLVALIGMDRYASWLQDDAHQFAADHAQVIIDGKDDRYYAAIGDFDNVYAYDAEILRERSLGDYYDPHSDYFWQWDNSGNRNTYRDLKITSDSRFNDTRFIAAVIGVNHLISVVDAVRLAIKHNKNLSDSHDFDMHAELLGNLGSPNGIRVTLTHRF